MLARSDPETARVLLRSAEDDVAQRWEIYEDRAAMPGRKFGLVEASRESQAIAAGKSHPEGEQ